MFWEFKSESPRAVAVSCELFHGVWIDMIGKYNIQLIWINILVISNRLNDRRS